MQILVIEDEAKIADVLKRGLTSSGYSVDIAPDGQTAQDKIELNPYDLIILDLMIPGVEGGGVGLCRSIRAQSIHTPILILTALSSTMQRVKGLDAGADDYMAKPFSIDELQARLRALLRRSSESAPVLLSVDDLSLDPATRLASRRDRQIALTAKEFALLEYLMRHPGRVINQSELIDHVWDYEYQGMSNIVETYIRYLRRKITRPGELELIQTVRGQGYKIGKQS